MEKLTHNDNGLNKHIAIEVEKIRKQHNFPALAVAFVDLNSSNQVKVYGSGYRKSGDATEIKLEDKFHLGSCTKTMTATLMAILIEENPGKLTWETTLSQLFKDFEIADKYKHVTIAMLAAHQSGITDDLMQMDQGKLWQSLWDLNKGISINEFWTKKPCVQEGRLAVTKAALKPQPQLTSKANYHFHYNNINHIILGAIIETVYKKDWEDLIKEKLFIPLGMSSAGFGPPAKESNSAPEQPWGHKLDSNNQLTPAHLDNPPSLGPSGTVHCSLYDWSKFVRFHLHGFSGQKTELLSAAGFKKLHENFKGNAYTCGAWIRTAQTWAKGVVLTHDGSNTYNYATVLMEPQNHRAMLVVTNDGSKHQQLLQDKSSLIAPLSKLFEMSKEISQEGRKSHMPPFTFRK